MSPKLKVPFLLFVIFVVNGSLLGNIHIDHVRPDAMLLLVTIRPASSPGPSTAPCSGSPAGVLVDLTLQTPFGLTALVLCAGRICRRQLQSTILRSTWWIPPATAVVGSVIGVGLFVILGALVGQSQLLRPGPARLASSLVWWRR